MLIYCVADPIMLYPPTLWGLRAAGCGQATANLGGDYSVTSTSGTNAILFITFLISCAHVPLSVNQLSFCLK